MSSTECECVKSCPNCGFDLTALKAFSLGSLTIIAGALVLWRGAPVPLSQTEVLLVSVLARARGAHVTLRAMCEAIGYEGDNQVGLISVNLSNIRAKFEVLDPHFDQIRRGARGVNSGRGGSTWWEIDDPLLRQLRSTSDQQRRTHKLLLLHPRSSLHELAALSGVRFNAIHQQLKRLERRGLVVRGPNYRRGWIATGSIELHRLMDPDSLGLGT